MLFGRNDANTETPVLWPRHVKSWPIGKYYDAGRDWGQEEKGMTEDEMAGWHYRLNGHEFEWTPGVGDGQGSLACCNSWGHKESDTTDRLNWTELNALKDNPSSSMRQDSLPFKEVTSHCMNTPHFPLFTHILMDIWVAFTSWLLWIMLHWIQVWYYAFNSVSYRPNKWNCLILLNFYF